MGPWDVFKWMIKIFFGGSFVVQRGWGCKGCVVGLFWFLGLGYLFIYMVSPIPDAEWLITRQHALIIAIIFIVIAIITGLIFKGRQDTFHGRNKPPD